MQGAGGVGGLSFLCEQFPQENGIGFSLNPLLKGLCCKDRLCHLSGFCYIPASRKIGLYKLLNKRVYSMNGLGFLGRVFRAWFFRGAGLAQVIGNQRIKIGFFALADHDGFEDFHAFVVVRGVAVVLKIFFRGKYFVNGIAVFFALVFQDVKAAVARLFDGAFMVDAEGAQKFRFCARLDFDVNELNQHGISLLQIYFTKTSFMAVFYHY